MNESDYKKTKMSIVNNTYYYSKELIDTNLDGNSQKLDCYVSVCNQFACNAIKFVDVDKYNSFKTKLIQTLSDNLDDCQKDLIKFRSPIAEGPIQ